MKAMRHLLGACLKRVAHEVKSAVLVNEFHYRHGSHKEEQRGGGSAQMALHYFSHSKSLMLSYGSWDILPWVDHE